MSEKQDINDTLRDEGADAVRDRHDRASKFTGGNGGDDSKSAPLPFIDMSDWDSTSPPPRRWAVPDRIPIRQPTLFSGEGSVGKTIVELQLCVAHVLGRDWLGFTPEKGPAIYFGAEDGVDELRRRITSIANHYGATFAQLIAGGLHLLSFAGEDALLGSTDRRGKIIPTRLFVSLLEAARDIRPKHIGLDTSADVFGGNEIDRAQVRQFVGMLRKVAIAADGAVVLLSHPSLTGINSGSGISGSTGWHNSVRARMYLKSCRAEERDQPESNLRELEFKKNNYGPVSDSVVLRWKDGLFLPEGSGTSFDQSVREQQVEKTFIDVLRKLVDQGHNVSPYPGKTYAPSLVAEHPGGAAFRSKDYAAAMHRLIDTRRARVEQFGSPSRQRSRIVVPDLPAKELF